MERACSAGLYSIALEFESISETVGPYWKLVTLTFRALQALHDS